jgi:hypothetical protein
LSVVEIGGENKTLKLLKRFVDSIGVRRGVSEGVEDSRRQFQGWPARRACKGKALRARVKL